MFLVVKRVNIAFCAGSKDDFQGAQGPSLFSCADDAYGELTARQKRFHQHGLVKLTDKPLTQVRKLLDGADHVGGSDAFAGAFCDGLDEQWRSQLAPGDIVSLVDDPSLGCWDAGGMDDGFRASFVQA